MVRLRRCFYKECKSNDNENRLNVTFFQAPSNAVKRDVWAKIIGRLDRTLKADDLVCELHFDKKYIINNMVKDVIYRGNKKKHLVRNAIPKGFVTETIVIKQEIDEVPVGRINDDCSTRDMLSEPNNAQPKNITEESTVIKNEITDELITNENESSSDLYKPILTVLIKEEFSTDLIKTENDNSIQESLLENPPINDIFMKFYTKSESFILNEYWGIFPCESNNNKQIILSQISVRSSSPIMERQIIISESLDLRYFFGNSEIKDPPNCLSTSAKSKQEIEVAINKFSTIHICYGGPPANLYKDMIGVTKCGYIDNPTGTWRHKKCTFISKRMYSLKQCVHCNSLHYRFQKKSTDFKNLKNKILVKRTQDNFEKIQKPATND